MRKIILFALVFSAFVLMINYASAGTVYDPPNDVYTWQWQEYGPRVDELYFKIADWNSVTPAQELYVDSFDATYTAWTMVGDSPYLNVADYPDSYIESSSYCSVVGFFSLEDMAPLEPGEEILQLIFEAHAWSDDPEIDGDIYIFGSDFSWIWVGSIEASTTGSWDLMDTLGTSPWIINYVDTPEEIADLRIVIHYWTPSEYSGPTLKIDALKLNIYTCTLEELQDTAMQTGEIDVSTSAYNLSKLDQEGFTITKAPEWHSCYIGFNMRKWPFMQDATGNAFRHATAHLVPKEDIIEALFKFSWGNITECSDNFLPPGQEPWLNPNIHKHPYSITEAVNILSDAGYTFIDNPPNQGLPSSIVPAGSEDYWLAPNGTQLPVIKLLSPLYSEAWTSYTLVNMTVERMHAAGLTNVVHEPMAFYTYMHDKVEHDHDFDMYWCCWGWLSDPSFLYDFYHSSQDFPDGDNRNGIHDSALDAELEVIHSSTDLTAIENAVSNAQMMLSELLPQVPVYSRNKINTFNPNLDGIVNTYGYGANNQWTFLNTHFQGIPLGGTLKWGLANEPSFLSPANTDNDYSLEVLDRIFDALLAKNPETGELMPWIATNWNVEPWMAPGNIPGMNMTFWLRDDVYWQDNVQFTAEDVKFSLEYIQEHELRGLWQNLVEVVVPPANPYVAKVYLNTSNYWLLYDVADAATLFPKHIWENVTAPLNFEPWNEPHPANPELTQLIGTGPFYFVEYVPKDHVLLRANPNYFKKLPTATSEEVGSSGGTVSNVAGTSSVEIPPGALTENTTITIEEYPTSEYGGFLINQTDKIVSFGVYKFGPTGTTFETNVTITLTYNETAVDESQLEQLVVYSSDDGVTWYQITIESVDTIENTITIKVHHFSLFVILQPTIYGVLTDEYTFQPIEGVTISILETGASTITDTQGRYSFVNIPDGNYTVEMTVPYGYLTHDAVTKFIEVTTSTEVSFTLYEESWSDGTVPRTIGYWKNWDKHYTPELVQTLIDKVKSASELFDELTIDNIGTYFKINRQSTMETKAQAQLLASWLNIVSAQLRIDIQVDITSISGWETVITDDDGILTVDVLLNQIDKCYVTDADLTKEQWETIKDILDALNNRLLFVT